MLHKLPLKYLSGNILLYKFGHLPETSQHMFFDCLFSNEVWKMFGIKFDELNIAYIDSIIGYIKGYKRTINSFVLIK